MTDLIISSSEKDRKVVENGSDIESPKEMAEIGPKSLDKEVKKEEVAEKKDLKKLEKSDDNGPSPTTKAKGDGIYRIGNPDKENTLDHVEMKREAINRVKLYVLCEQRVWDDRGTGHVMWMNSTDEDSPSNSSSYVIIVRLESQDYNVLESRILLDTVYQKQQETLIVWSESDTCDLALSFQEKSGCEEIWAKICEVQGRDPGDPDGGYDDLDDNEVSGTEPTSATSRLALPPIEIGRLSEIEGLIQMHLTTSTLREKMANVIENEDVLPKLCETFQMCEDIEHTEGLKTFHSIAKNLFMLNRTSLNELLLDDRYMRDLLGMLEYDPNSEKPRKHREFVYEKATFREVLNISSEELREKIQKTYRVQYIQDVCLPSMGLFEENLLSALNSHIFFSRVDIVTMLQKDKRLMKDLFEQLKDEKTTPERRKELAQFLKEFITLSQGLPPSGAQSKDNFFKNLQTNDVLGTLEPCIRSDDPETRSTVVEMLCLLVEHNPQVVREYFLRQSKEKKDDELLISKLIQHMLTDKDPDLNSGTQVALILKILLDPENMVGGLKADRSEFLNLFYQRCMHTLLKPMIENVQGGTLKKDDYVTANRQSIVVRLLCFCIEHHSLSMRQHCISTDLLNKILVLLKSKHHFLSLHALKMLRKVVAVKDDFYLRYIVREKVLDAVFECFKANGTRYNLLNSAMLHLFDYIKSEDIKILIKYIVENHSDVVESVTYVRVFYELKQRYEQHKDREELLSNRSEDSRASSPNCFKSDREEEAWFDDDDGDALNAELPKKENKKEETQRKTGIEPMFPSVLKRKNALDDDDSTVFSPVSTVLHEKKIVIKVSTDRSPSRTPSPSTSPRTSPSPGPSRDDEVSSSQNNSKENSPAPTIKSLVDYDESDSDSDDDSASSPDAVPTSSTGSPEQEKEKPSDSKKSPDSPEHNDVSSTSSEESKPADSGSADVAADAVAEEDDVPTENTTEVLRRKRPSDDRDSLDPVKRHRGEETAAEA